MSTADESEFACQRITVRIFTTEQVQGFLAFILGFFGSMFARQAPWWLEVRDSYTVTVIYRVRFNLGPGPARVGGNAEEAARRFAEMLESDARRLRYDEFVAKYPPNLEEDPGPALYELRDGKITRVNLT